MSMESLLVTFSDLELPQYQSQKSYRVKRNTLVQDLIQFIQSTLDNNYDIYLYFEKDKLFTGNVNMPVWQILTKQSQRNIAFRKVLSQPSHFNNNQYSQNLQQSSQNYENQESSYYNKQPIKQIQNQIPPELTNTNDQPQYPSIRNFGNQNNYAIPAQPMLDHNKSIGTYPYQAQDIMKSYNNNNQKIIEDLNYKNQFQHYGIESQFSNQELENIKQENTQLQIQISQIQKKYNEIFQLNKDYEQQIRQLQIRDQEREKIQVQSSNQNKALQSEIERLQQELKQYKYQQYNNQIEQEKKYQTYGQINKKLEHFSTKDQYGYNEGPSVEKSQLAQSQYQNGVKENYKNSCGHNLTFSQIEIIVQSSLNKKQKAQCSFCQNSISTKLCLLVEPYGKSYLDMKNQFDLQQLIQGMSKQQIYKDKIIKCQSKNCNFFCLWQKGILVLNGKNYIQIQNGFCPNCLQMSVIGPQQQTYLSQTAIYQNPQRKFY